MHKAIFITVRTGSTRLPRKALLDILPGTPTIVYLMRRVKTAKLADRVVLCTTELPDDDILCELASKEGVDFFRGSAEDKLERWRGAAEKYGVDCFVTADGDDVLCEPELLDLGLKQFTKPDAPDFIEAPHVACGAFTYGIKVSALKKVCEIKDSSQTEMMWVYFKETGLFKLALLEGADPVFLHPEIRLTLDYEDDFKFFKTVIDTFEAGPKPYGLRQILPYLVAHPEITAINAYLQEAFLENQRKKTNLKLK
jgi:spore coat polysaccharide biosynthesis protein SpsF